MDHDQYNLEFRKQGIGLALRKRRGSCLCGREREEERRTERKPFLFTSHLLKRREIARRTVSGRERQRVIIGWDRGKDGVDPTINLQERDGLGDYWLQPWAERRKKAREP